jgi:Icc-related predicted phosphoesterase
MIRVAAVGDVHLGPDNAGRLRPALERLDEHSDVLLLAGDLTRHGDPAEADVVAAEFADLPVPVVAVLGNHDHHGEVPEQLVEKLTAGGIRVLEGDAVVLPCAGRRVGVAGVKGFGGGFAGKSGSAFGEPEMKAFIRHSEQRAGCLAQALRDLGEVDLRIALTHYAPVPETLRGEPPEIFPFLGSYLLAEAIDSVPTDLALHGHAHFGVEQGCTPGGTRVRNVAQPVIRRAYAVYELNAPAPA